jgi:hypothetical protein
MGTRTTLYSDEHSLLILNLLVKQQIRVPRIGTLGVIELTILIYKLSESFWIADSTVGIILTHVPSQVGPRGSIKDSINPNPWPGFRWTTSSIWLQEHNLTSLINQSIAILATTYSPYIGTPESLINIVHVQHTYSYLESSVSTK